MTETQSREAEAAREMGQATTEARGAEARVGIVGVGNCAAALLGRLSYYRHHPEDEVGLRHPEIGGMRAGDIRPVAAWDVDADKVGWSLPEALFAGLNCVEGVVPDAWSEVRVRRGPVLDGLGRSYRSRIRVAETADPAEDLDVDRHIRELEESGAEVLLNYLPVGSEEATRYWATAAAAAGVAFVNCIPVFIASDPEWVQIYREAGVPLVGDDIKSQLGATVLHRALARLFRERGIRLDRTYQLNVGGNMDFVNLMDGDRIETKRRSKTGAVLSEAPHLAEREIHISPSAHVPWLRDRKWAYVRMEGRGWGGAPVAAEVKLEVEDSPNSAGVVVDAVRCAALARRAGIGGVLRAPATVMMKSPPGNAPDDSAADAALDSWIAEAEREAASREG